MSQESAIVIGDSSNLSIFVLLEDSISTLSQKLLDFRVWVPEAERSRYLFGNSSEIYKIDNVNFFLRTNYVEREKVSFDVIYFKLYSQISRSPENYDLFSSEISDFCSNDLPVLNVKTRIISDDKELFDISKIRLVKILRNNLRDFPSSLEVLKNLTKKLEEINYPYI